MIWLVVGACGVIFGTAVALLWWWIETWMKHEG